jgi:hypothetical protein
MSAVQRRRLIALVALAAAIVGVIVLVSGSGSSQSSAPGTRSRGHAAPEKPAHLQVRRAGWSLPAPLSGEAVVDRGDTLLVIGGVDSADVSTRSVIYIDPKTGENGPFGSLSQPLHDAAAAPVPSGVLVFGGGAASTTADVQRLVPGGTGEVVGSLPAPTSDLSAVSTDGTAYVLGGYDGQTTVSSVLATGDGHRLTQVARLPVPVRYAAVALQGKEIYAIGGELSDGRDSSAIQAVDLLTGQSTIVGRLPQTLAHASAVMLRGHVYVLGGRLAGSTSDRIFRFDPQSAAVTAAGHLPAPLQNAAATVIRGTGYLVGGLDPAGAPVAGVIEVRLSGEP